MRCEKKVKLRSKIVRSRNQGVSVVGWVDVWGWDKVAACMVGLLAAGCRVMGRGCGGVRSLMSVLQRSGGVVVLSIERSGLNRVVWWISSGIGLSSTWIREVGLYRE